MSERKLFSPQNLNSKEKTKISDGKKLIFSKKQEVNESLGINKGQGKELDIQSNSSQSGKVFKINLKPLNNVDTANSTETYFNPPRRSITDTIL